MALARLPKSQEGTPPSMYMRHETGQSGFTLVEVMVVTGIIAIGSMLAMPAYTQWNARYQLRQATTELVSNLTLARMAAMNRNTPVNVALAVIACPPATSNCGHISVTSGALPAATIMPREITGFAGGPVQFSPLGLLVGGGANQLVALQAQTNTGLMTYSAVVTPAGKVNWCAKGTCP
ncbi:MAG: pilus assembly FimT family protein [Nitrospiraceae bacterium]